MSHTSQPERVDANPAGLPPEEEHPQDYMTLAARAAAEGDWQEAAHDYAQAVERRAAELALINSVQEGLSAKLEMQAIYDLVGDKLRDTFNAQVVMISQYDPASQHIFHHYAIERGQHLHIQGWRPIDSSRAQIVRQRRPFMINLAEITRVVNAGMMQVVPGTELPKTWLGVPMMVGEEVRGIVSLQNLDCENAFSQSDIELLTALTNSMSQSLENARLFNETQRLLNLLEGEMEIARRTQQSILPARAPRQAGYDLGALIVPARAVCGDFYDFIHLDRQRLCVLVGDVSDKGLPAALFMALTFSLVRAETERSDNPIQILQNVNRHLLKMNASGMFVTLLYCVLDFKTGRFHYCRAGHSLPLQLDAAGAFAPAARMTGQPLGVFADVRIDQQAFTIPQGGMALLYTDGLNEASDAQGQEFGLERAQQTLAAHRQEDAHAICQRLWQAVQAHSGAASHQDDFTAVVIKRQLP